MSAAAPSRHILRVKKLYKTIQSLHKHLPSEMQNLGTVYARDEFKRHKKCTPHEANVFMCEWTRYAITLAQQLGVKGPTSSVPLEHTLEQATLEDFREEQIVQLYELMLAAKNKEADKEAAAEEKT